ncbi:hypothetical protein HDU83_004918 [Entophlyctis luteolus]|nr:hypothetical protein HDU83_004918 [Entophlyctis luteolus]
MVVRASEVESITARLRSLAPSAGGTATLDALCALSALLDRLDTSPPPSTSMLRSQLVPASLLVPALQSLQHITSVPESLSDEDASLCSRIIGELQQSFCLLRSSKKLRQLAQTSLEQAALLCVEACETTSAVLARLPSQTILSFAADVLLETSSVIHTVANSKKTFQTVVSKLLAPLMKLNDFVISQCSNSNSKFGDLERLESALDQLISSTIFHKDQMLDYISALQVVVGKPQNTKDSNSFALWCLKIASNIGRNKTMKASYQMQFFDQVAGLLKAENCECFLSTLPHLLELFIKSRKLHMKSHDSNFSFNVDFAVFLVLFSLVISSDANISETQEVQLPDMLLKLAESRALGNERRASAISGMVKVLAKMEVYRATQDEVSRMQFWVLETICAAFVRFLVEPQTSKTQESFESITFEIATSLLEIEHSIVADSMEDLMSTAVLVIFSFITRVSQLLLFKPRQKTRRSALQFAICLMNSLSRSRELETFFEQVFRSLKNRIIENCGTCVFLDKVFLKEFVLVSPFMNRLIDALRELLSEALEASLDDIFTKVVAPLVQTETDDATKDGKQSLASSSLDPKVEPGCVELVEEVFDWVWPNVIQPEISSTWDGQVSSLDRNSFGVAVWACISDHLIPICQLLPKERTKAIVEWFASSLGNGNIASNSDISYYSVSVSLLRSSQFYEIRTIRDILLFELLSIITVSLPKAGIDSSFTKLFTEILAQNQTALFAATFVELLRDHGKGACPCEIFPVESLKRTNQLVSVLNLFPVAYFSNSDCDMLISFLLLLELVFCHSKDGGSSEMKELRLKFAAVCRKLGARFMESRSDALITLQSPKIIDWWLKSAVDYRASTHELWKPSETSVTVLTQESLFIAELTFKKVFQRISGSLLKGSTCSPEEYLVKTNSVIAELTSDKAFHFEVLTCLIRSLVSSPVFKKRSALPTITADADSRASVLENIDIMNCLSPVIIEAENEVLAELLHLHGDIARKFANANFLENIMSALGLFEQLLDFKACYILEKSSSVEEMFKSAEKFLKYMSDNVSVFSEEHVTELGAKLLSLQLNRLKNLESIESEVAKDSFISESQLKSTFLGPDDLFDSLCRLLGSLLSHRREQLLDCIPAFVGILRGLLHCFRQELGGLQSAFSRQIQLFYDSCPYRYFSGTKLINRVVAAQHLSRIFEKMGQKSVSSSSGSGASAQQAILQTSAAATVRPFAMHAGFLVAEFVAIQASTSPIGPANVRLALIKGVYSLLDLCGEFGRNAVLAGLEAPFSGTGGAARTVFKELVSEWEASSYRPKE